MALSLLLIGLALLGLSPSQSKQILGEFENTLELKQPGLYSVAEFIDGDTIGVSMNHGEERVRFIGIDTPEKNHPKKPVQCYAQAASKHLKDLIGNNSVRLEADPTNQNRDRYDRLLRYVYLSDGTFLNAKMIEDGYAFAYTAFPFEKLDEFRALEQNARDNNLGLWGSCEIIEDNGYLNTAPVD